MTYPSWSARHFSLANALDDRPDDLPHLLRRMAQHIEDLGLDPMEIRDLVLHSDITEVGPHWSMTFYWSSGEPGR